MNNLISKVDVAYLPTRSHDPYQFLDDVDLNVLNEGYEWCNNVGARSYCTYLDLVSLIESSSYRTKLCTVIDFPDGDAQSEEKIFEAGRAFEICKKASCAELDVVLNMSTMGAIDDFRKFIYSHVDRLIGVKYIVELGHRNEENLDKLLRIFNLYEDNIKFIKTNTGKLEKIDHGVRVKLVQDLRSKTKIPIKVSGGISSWQEMIDYINVAGEDTIFGVSYEKIKDWD